MIASIETAIAPYQHKLKNHSLYPKIKSPKDLKVFMEFHVFAVWDFMSLLKGLQKGLTCTDVPWKPVGNPNTRYLINEIVLAEETDINLQGNRQSHYEMYLDAMKKATANTTPILDFVATISAHNIEEHIKTAEFPEAIKSFLSFSFETIATGKMHLIAAAFTFGREDLIPDMFTEIIAHIQQHFPKEDLTLFKYYFDRHIELDGDTHGPLALQMIEELCGDDTRKWEEVKQVSIKALEVRLQLWDGIEKAIN